MTRKVKVLALGVTLSLGISIGAAASSTIKNVTAQIDYNVKMVLNGVSYNPTESDGSAIRPLTYNGRTYLPVKYIGQAAGLAVTWDAKSKTVILGEKDKVTGVQSFLSEKKYYSYTVDPDLLFINNTTYKYGYVCINTYGDAMKFKVDGTYQKVYCDIGVLEDTTIIVTNLDNDAIVKQIEVKAGETAKIEGNIEGASNISIGTANSTKTYDKIVIGDPYFK